jgi:predicted small metal-binding protein
MKQLRCGDVIPGCKAVFRESTEDAILNAVARHIRRDHGMYQIPASLVAQVRKNIAQPEMDEAVLTSA